MGDDRLTTFSLFEPTIVDPATLFKFMPGLLTLIFLGPASNTLFMHDFPHRVAIDLIPCASLVEVK